MIESGRYRAFRKSKEEEEEEGKEKKKGEEQRDDKEESKTITLASYDNKGSLGELALLYGSPRAATVVAETSGVIWALDRSSFASAVHGAAARRHEAVAAALAASPLFAALDDDAVAAVADCVKPVEFACGDIIIAAGEQVTESSKFYLVEAGEVECSRRLVVAAGGGGGGGGAAAAAEAEAEAAVAAAVADVAAAALSSSMSSPSSAATAATVSRVVVKPGGWFGEVGLLGAASSPASAESGTTQTVRAADVIALSPTVKVLSLGRDAFARLAGGAASMAIAERLREYQRLDAEAAEAAVAAASEKRRAENEKDALNLIQRLQKENNEITKTNKSSVSASAALDDGEQLRNAGDEVTKEQEKAEADAEAVAAATALLSPPLPPSSPPAAAAPTPPPRFPPSASPPPVTTSTAATFGLNRKLASSIPRVSSLIKKNREPTAAPSPLPSPSPSGATSAAARRAAGAAALARNKKPSSNGSASTSSSSPRSPKVARAAWLPKKKEGGITFGGNK